MVEEAWGIWCAEKGLDYDAVMQVAHGRRKPEILAIVLPGWDPQPEIDRLTALEGARIGAVKKIAGAAELVAKLPEGRWAIATSGERPAALARLRQVGIIPPAVVISAEDVSFGKPNPEVYLKAAAGIGIVAERCLVFEDAPAGIAAARAVVQPSKSPARSSHTLNRQTPRPFPGSPAYSCWSFHGEARSRR